jgi:hypothetical protein
MRDYVDFLFTDEATGEDFFVELPLDGHKMSELLAQAQETADEFFAKAVFQEVMTPDDAAMMGLDTY